MELIAKCMFRKNNMKFDKEVNKLQSAILLFEDVAGVFLTEYSNS